MKNTFCWMQFQGSHLKECKKFYSDLFSWALKESDCGHPYTEIDAGEGPCGGMMEAPAGAPSMWLPFVQVLDIKASMQKATQLGGTVLVEVTDIPDNGGCYSVISDPSGASIGFYQSPN